ncbi:MAG: OmpH family outer membrane protein [Flavobacteriales bacterium]|nr:OmpH family outer membrane protein [Flavobacteriales bacterium]
MIKKIIFLVVLAMGSGTAFAQKFAYVDTDFIMSKIPAYNEAQEKLNGISEDWQKEVEEKYKEVEKMYKAFQVEEVLLSETMKAKKEEEIVKKENDARSFQKSIFGVNGELFKKRQELIKPIQEEIYKAIKDLATSSSYAIIFDKASGATMLYSSSKYDKSKTVLKNLGYN